MAVEHTFSQTEFAVAGHHIKTCVYSGAALQAISRSAIADLPYVGEGEAHPTLSGVIRDSETLFPVSGQISCTYTWSAEDHDDVVASLSGWQSIVDRADTTVTIDQDARRATVVIDGDYNHADWVDHPTKWIPKAPAAAATASSASKIVCIERLQDPDGWTLEYLCVAAEASKQIAKQGTNCFLFVSGAATIGSTNVEAGETIKMQSDNVTITAAERCVVVRMYK